MATEPIWQLWTFTVEMLTGVLLHCIWILTLTGLLLSLFLRCIPQQASAARCRLLTFGLLLMLATPISLFLLRQPDALTDTPESPVTETSLQTDESAPLSSMPHPRAGAPSESVAVGSADQITGSSPGAATPEFTSASSAVSQEARTKQTRQHAATAFPGLLSFRTRSVIVGIWLQGVVVFAIRPAIGVARIRHLRSRGLSPVSDELAERFVSLLQQLQVSTTVSLHVSAHVTVPLVTGVLKPMIVLPTSAFSGLTTDELAAILAHEIAHVRRRDLLVNAIQIFVETFLFFHPAVWWLSRRLHEERECCCDELAAATMSSRLEYGRTLLKLSELQSSPTPLTAVAASNGSLTMRIRRLCAAPSPGSSWSTLLIGGLTLAGLFLAAVQLTAQADETPVVATHADLKSSQPETAGKSHEVTLLKSDGSVAGREIHVRFVPAGYQPSRSPQRLKPLANGVWKTPAPGGFVILPEQNSSVNLIRMPRESADPVSINRTRARHKGLTVERCMLRDFDPQASVYIEIKNDSSKPYLFSATDLHLRTDHWRIFPGKSLAGEKLDPGRTRGVTLSLHRMVQDGLWIPRTLEDPARASIPRSETGRMICHVEFNAGQSSPAVELPTPEIILRQLEARRQATSELVFARSSWFIGEPIEVTYRVLNRGTLPIKVEWGGDSRAPRPLRHKIQAVGPNGRAADPHPNPHCFGGMGSMQVVKPGEHYDMVSVSLAQYCLLTTPGRYEITAWHDLGWEPEGPYDDLLKNEIPSTRTAPLARTTITLRAPTETEAADVLQRLIDSFPAANRPHDIFASLRHNAYLPALSAWIRRNGGTLVEPQQSVQQQKNLSQHENVYGRTAVRAIGSIETTEATQLLLTLLEHEDSQISETAKKQLSLRVPLPWTQMRSIGQSRQAQRMASRAWNDQFRAPLLAHVLRSLRLSPDDRDENTTTESHRNNQILDAGLLQGIVRRSDYPALVRLTDPLTAYYPNLAEEQFAYPRPRTLTQSFAVALWYSLCDGNSECDLPPEHLEQMFREGRLDVFSTARLLKDMPEFRPAGWQRWVAGNANHRIPWVRSVVTPCLQKLPPLERVAHIQARLTDISPTVQIEAIQMAGSSPSPEYVTALDKVVQRNNQWLAPRAAEVLAKCKAAAAELSSGLHEFSVEFENPFANVPQTRIHIDAEGLMSFSVEGDPRLKLAPYRTTFQLTGQTRQELLRTLDESQWLSAAVDRNRPPAGHPSKWTLKVRRTSR